MKQLARKKGADLIEIFKYTSYSTPTEYFEETTELDRAFLSEAVKEYNRKKNEALKS